MPAFSVIIPARNRPELLREAIDSVMRQTVSDWEIVVVDDGSEPPLVIPDDARISLVRLPVASGPARARNTGVSASLGDALTFLDDDDLFTEDRLELAREGLSRSPVATCWIRVLGERTRNNVILEGDVSDTVLDHLTPSLGATAVRRSAFLPFDGDLRGVEDVEWWLRTAAASEVTTVTQVGYLVRRRLDDTDPARADQLRVRAQENVLFIERREDYFSRHPRAAAFRLRRAALILMAIGDLKPARRLLWQSLARRRSWSTVGHLLRSFAPGIGGRIQQVKAHVTLRRVTRAGSGAR